jgi:hypothetical protein
MTGAALSTSTRLRLAALLTSALVAACGRIPLDGPATGGAGSAAAAGSGAAGAGSGAAGAGSGAAGAPTDMSGPACGKVHCAAKQICCLLDGSCIDPATAATACPRPPAPPDPSPPSARPCGSNADCAANEFCGTSLACLGPGTCMDRNNCGTSWGAKFCGCDGKTYPDVQTACRAGVSTGPRVGACGTVSRPGDADHDPLIFCARDDQCPAGLTCCAFYGKCVDPALPELCTPPPAGTRSSCVTDRQCDPMFEFCEGPGCSGPGGCMSITSGSCTGVLDPVCGCDGKTYTSEGCTLATPVRTAHNGACTLQN